MGGLLDASACPQLGVKDTPEPENKTEMEHFEMWKTETDGDRGTKGHEGWPVEGGGRGGCGGRGAQKFLTPETPGRMTLLIS